MLLFDLMVRFGALALMLFLVLRTAIRLGETRRGQTQSILLIAASLGLCGPLIIAIPPPLAPSPAVQGAANLVASPNVVLSFLCGLSIFTDGSRWRPWHGVLLAVVTILSFISRLPVSLSWGVWDHALSTGLIVLSVGLDGLPSCDRHSRDGGRSVAIAAAGAPRVHHRRGLGLRFILSGGMGAARTGEEHVASGAQRSVLSDVPDLADAVR